MKYASNVWLFERGKDFLFAVRVILSEMNLISVVGTQQVNEEELMKAIQSMWSRPLTQWVVKTLYYLFILLALLGLYGFKDTNSSTFIYNEF